MSVSPLPSEIDMRQIIGDLLEKMCLEDLEAMVTILQKKFREYKLKEKTTIGSLLKNEVESEPKLVVSIPLSILTPRQEREVEVRWSRPHEKEVRWSPILGL